MPRIAARSVTRLAISSSRSNSACPCKENSMPRWSSASCFAWMLFLLAGRRHRAASAVCRQLGPDSGRYVSSPGSPTARRAEPGVLSQWSLHAYVPGAEQARPGASGACSAASVVGNRTGPNAGSTAVFWPICLIWPMAPTRPLSSGSMTGGGSCSFAARSAGRLPPRHGRLSAGPEII